MDKNEKRSENKKKKLKFSVTDKFQKVLSYLATFLVRMKKENCQRNKIKTKNSLTD